MKNQSAKRAVSVGAGAAFALSSLAVLAPTPAGAAGSGSVIVAKAPGVNVLYLGVTSTNSEATRLRVHSDPTNPQSVIFDSSAPILNYYAPDCVLAWSGNPNVPFRETCPDVTTLSVSGSNNADDMAFNVPGHSTDVHSGSGADTLRGSAAQHDEFHAGKGRDTLYVEDGDIAACGQNNDGTGPDSQVDTVYYNGTPTFKHCNFAGGGTLDVATYSSKA